MGQDLAGAIGDISEAQSQLDVVKTDLARTMDTVSRTSGTVDNHSTRIANLEGTIMDILSDLDRLANRTNLTEAQAVLLGNEVEDVAEELEVRDLAELDSHLLIPCVGRCRVTWVRTGSWNPTQPWPLLRTHPRRSPVHRSHPQGL